MKIQKKIIQKITFLTYEIISKLSSAIRVKHDNIKFKIKTTNSHEVHRALTFKDKEPETLRWIDSFDVSKGDVVFYDIGANIGIYSLYAAAKHQGLKVLAFEPESQSFGSLCLNIYHNNLHVTPYPIGISDDDGIAKLNISILLPGAGASALNESYAFMNNERVKEFQQGIYHSSIDSLVYKNALPAPNYIKIDVDGIEKKILQGADLVLQSSCCIGVLVELQYKKNEDVDSICQLMKGYGFELSERSKWVNEFKGIKSQNFIFNKM
jgi:FkbM family methyltransferase